MIDELPSSAELALVRDTVASESQHEYLVEAIENLCQRLIAEIQRDTWKQINQLKKFLEEQKQKDFTKKQLKEVEIQISKKIDDILQMEEVHIRYAKASRMENLRQLYSWERSVS